MSGSWPLERVPAGFRTLSVEGSAVGLASATGGIPKNASRAVITVEGEPIRWRDDSVAPTTSVGNLVPVAGIIILPSVQSINQFKAISTTGDASIDINYYSDSLTQ